MFGIGPVEFGVVLVLALLIMGPKKLPELARSLGRGMAEFRKASNELRRSMDMDLPDYKIAPPPGPAQAGLDNPSVDKSKHKKEKEESAARGAGNAADPSHPGASSESVPVTAATRSGAQVTPDGLATDGHGDGSTESIPVDTRPPPRLRAPAPAPRMPAPTPAPAPAQEAASATASKPGDPEDRSGD